MKLTPVFQLNDPFEAKLTKDFIDGVVAETKRFFPSGKMEESTRKSLEDNGRYEGVLSLSRKNTDILMLSHYAADHKGGILEFTISDNINEGFDNKTSLFKRSINAGYKFGNVNYVKNRRLDFDINDLENYLSTEVFLKNMRFGGMRRR